MKTTTLAIAAIAALAIIGFAPTATAIGIHLPYGDCTVNQMTTCIKNSVQCPTSPPASPYRQSISDTTQTPASVLLELQPIHVTYADYYSPATGMRNLEYTLFSACGHPATVCTVAPVGYENAQGGYCYNTYDSYMKQNDPTTWWAQAPTTNYCNDPWYYDCAPNKEFTVELTVTLSDPLPVGMISSQDFRSVYQPCGQCG